LEVDSDRATYKKKLEVLQEQEELIEDEAEQEEVRENFILWSSMLTSLHVVRKKKVPGVSGGRLKAV
jgi:hypothetical protein